MKKLLVVLGCLLLVLSACGKDENKDKATDKEAMITPAESEGEEVVSQSELMARINGDSEKFLAEFDNFSDAQKYYFCAAFAMGAMSVSKPVTASAMVNYFMGLGVARYNEGINDKNYVAFNAGKNTFLYEALVNTVLENKTCEDIMNDAADFAKKRNYNVADLDKQGKKEVARVLRYIQNDK